MSMGNPWDAPAARMDYVASPPPPLPRALTSQQLTERPFVRGDRERKGRGEWNLKLLEEEGGWVGDMSTERLAMS